MSLINPQGIKRQPFGCFSCFSFPILNIYSPQISFLNLRDKGAVSWLIALNQLGLLFRHRFNSLFTTEYFLENEKPCQIKTVCFPDSLQPAERLEVGVPRTFFLGAIREYLVLRRFRLWLCAVRGTVGMSLPSGWQLPSQLHAHGGENKLQITL